MASELSFRRFVFGPNIIVDKDLVGLFSSLCRHQSKTCYVDDSGFRSGLAGVGAAAAKCKSDVVEPVLYSFLFNCS